MFCLGHGGRLPRKPIRIDRLEGQDVAYIPLGRDLWAIVEKRDIPLVSNYTWRPQWNAPSQTFYAVRGYRIKGQRQKHTIIMHRQLMNVLPGFTVDHINGNGLDNRRKNLRIATYSENCRNKHRLSRHNTSGRTGVAWNSECRKWVASIKLDYKRIYLGMFPTFEEAKQARLEAELQYHGAFRRQTD